MSLLNYSTVIKTEKTVSEIQGILAEAGAQAVMSEFDDARVLTAISFRMNTSFGLMSYRLPSRIDPIWKILSEDRNIRPKFRTWDQASRVAWRIIKDWIEAQLALVEADQADIDQVFLPYMEINAGVTVFDRLKEKPSLLLGNK